MDKVGFIAPSGSLGLKVIKDPSKVRDQLSVAEIIRYGFPSKEWPKGVRAWKKLNLPYLYRGLRRVFMARMCRLPNLIGSWGLLVIRANGDIEDLGLVSLRVVTDVGVGSIVDAFDGGVGYTLSNYNYHGMGTATKSAGEEQTDTALETELTTEYNPDNTRDTGTQSQPAANQYRTVGTNAVDSAVAIVEHGIFSQAAVGGGDLLDRSEFSVINLANGDSLQSTYTLTLTAGS